MMKFLWIAGAVIALTPALPAYAQAQPDRFQIDMGGFHLSAETKLKLNRPGKPGTEVVFENDLKIPDTADTYWMDATWRVARRHHVRLTLTGLSREGNGTTLTRDITWGDSVFKAGVQATGKTSTDIVAGYYRFAVVRNDRFEIGPSIGLGYLKTSAGITATASVSGSAGSASAPIEVSGSKGTPTGDLGLYFVGWPSPKVAVRGDLLYILVKPNNSTQSIADARLGLDVYPWKHVGFGAQYKLYKYRADRDILSTELGGSIKYSGFQGFLSFLF